MSISERKKELRRRRHRKKKLGQWSRRLGKATVSERTAMAEKIRGMTPGADVIIHQWGLEGR